MKQTATLRYLRIPPRKARLIANLVKGLPVTEAEAQLMMHRQRASKPILKLLRSAVANAKAARKLDASKLFIESFRVDGGPMLKRYLPRARGSASPIQKKMSHLTLTLAELKEAKDPRFTIVVAKKTRITAEGKNRVKPRIEEGGEEKKGGKSGFFKRTFQRKAV